MAAAASLTSFASAAAMRSQWSSPVFHNPIHDGRHRDVFPLPSLAVEQISDRSVCREVQRRVLRRGQLAMRANQAIMALNSLFSGEPFGHCSGVVEEMSLLPLFQQRALSDIMAAVKRLGAPLHDTGPGALSTLRAAGSSYCEAESGVGDVVPLAFSDLSLPSKGVVGVDLLEALDGPLRAVVDDFEGAMLQDSSVWTAISRDASHLKPYSDPCLKHRKNFLKFVQLLFDRGLVSFTSNHRGFVGAFSVAKKSKIVDGVLKKRQRLVLDCRQTNQLFRPSPYTQLGSLASLCELQLPSGQQLYLSSADIQDCFYAVHIPEKMQEFFCLEGWLDASDIYNISRGALQLDDSVRYTPCFTVLPMGFSWSFYLVQQIHQSAVCRSLGIPESSLLKDGFPAPRLQKGEVLSMPYCDNIHSISMDPESCNFGKQKIVNELARLGFTIHEEEDAAVSFQTLGGEVDGAAGEVRMTRQRAWTLIRAFEYVAEHPVSPSTIQRLLGHAMFFSTLNRNGMAVFRKLYDFVERGGKTRRLTTSESRECKIFAGIIPLLFASIRRPWSDDVLCSDASPDGHGLCSRHLPTNVIDSIGRWNERWRYKRLEPEHWQPRQRALGLEPLEDVETVLGYNTGDYEDQYIVNNDDFPEVPNEVLYPGCWKTTLMGKWLDTTEHITVKEGRALVLCLKRLCRSVGNRDKRHLIFVDNLALALCISKGRAKNFTMLRICQQVSALSLVGSFSIRLRWVPSERNPADGPSRGQISPGSYSQTGPSSPPDNGQDSGRNSDHALAKAGSTSTVCANFGQQGAADAGFQEAELEGAEAEEWCDTRRSAAQETDHKDPCGSGIRHWPQSSNRSPDSTGDEVRLCGSEESVPAVLPQIREFLPGQRVAVAPRRPVRCNTRRLPGHFLLGGQVSCGRRKNGSGSRIHESQSSGKAPSVPSRSERVAARNASRQSPSSTKSAGGRYGNEAHCQRQKIDGTEANGRSRHLCTSWRIHRAQRQGCGAACDRRRAAIPVVCHSHSRSRRLEARQDRRVRQLDPIQQPTEGILGGDVVETVTDAEQCTAEPLSLHSRSVPKSFCRSWSLSGSSQSPSLPDKAWRSFRGPESERAGCNDCEESRKMGHRPEPEEIWKSRQNTAAAHQIVTKQSGVLSVVEQKHGSSPEGNSSSKEPLNGLGWTDLFSLNALPPKFSLEIFAGTARVTQCLSDHGLRAFPLDICLFPSHNVLDIHIEHRIIHWLVSHRIAFVWLGMPCTSFSRARKWDSLGPGPLRDVDNLWGFPWLSRTDKQKVEQGNALLRFTLRCMTVCEEHGIPYAIENPLSSFAWMMPPMKKFCSKFHPTEAVLDFCQYLEPWQKPTKILGNFWPLQQLTKRCRPFQGLCSMSCQPHVHLSGTDAAGNFMTLKAQPYPWALAAEVARLVAGAIH